MTLLVQTMCLHCWSRRQQQQSDYDIAKPLVNDKLKRGLRRRWRQCFLRAERPQLPEVWQGLRELGRELDARQGPGPQRRASPLPRQQLAGRGENSTVETLYSQPEQHPSQRTILTRPQCGRIEHLISALMQGYGHGLPGPGHLESRDPDISIFRSPTA